MLNETIEAIAAFAFNLLVLLGALVVIVPVAGAVLLTVWLLAELLADAVKSVRAKRAEKRQAADS